MGNLGYMYHVGYGMAKNGEEAVKWYKKAADYGNVYALGQLGEMYELGSGVPKDPTEAIKWYKKAADQGHSHAKARLQRLGVNVKW